MGVSAEAHKIFKCSVYSGGVDDVLLRLPLIELIIKDANLMRISFRVKQPLCTELFPIFIYTHLIHNWG